MTNKTNNMTKKEINQDELFMYDWVFHYNTYTNQWAAIPRHLYNSYWSNLAIEGVLRSTNIDTLIKLINKGEGDVDKVKSYVDRKFK